MADAGNPIPAPPSDAESLWRLARQLALTPLECEAALVHAWQAREFKRAGHREVILKLDDDGGLCPISRRVNLASIRERLKVRPAPIVSG